jgi:hypothetical protein
MAGAGDRAQSLRSMSTASSLAIIALFWLGVGLVQTFNWGSGVPKAIVMLALLCAAPFAIAAAHRQRPALRPGFERAARIALAIALLLNLAYLGARIIAPHVIDIATTTLAAGQALVHDQNPYALPIDQGPEAAGFTGYKYLPMMIATYLPLGLPLGQRGILLTNLLLLAAILALLKRLSGSALGPLLLVMIPLVAEQIFAKGATDLAAVLPLLAGLVLYERRPFLAGIALGLSIATKLLPGVVMAPALIPPRDRGLFIAGVAVGLLPVLPFVIADANAVIGNIVLFNLARSADATSWLQAMPAWIVNLAHAVLTALIIGVAGYVWRSTPTLTTRSGLAAMLGIAAILAGPGAHHNYQLWWLPFYALLLARFLAEPVAEACQSARVLYTNAADLPLEGS